MASHGRTEAIAATGTFWSGVKRVVALVVVGTGAGSAVVKVGGASGNAIIDKAVAGANETHWYVPAAPMDLENVHVTLTNAEVTAILG